MKSHGFTLIELMITLAIMGTLAMVAVPMAQLTIQREKERALRIALIEIREGLDAYKRASEQGRIQLKIGESGYPKRLEDLVEGVPDQRSPAKKNIYFLRRIPRDPFYPNTDANSVDTWAYRSYASPPDDPSEGEDVFDISSRSQKIGLNGIPFNKW